MDFFFKKKNPYKLVIYVSSKDFPEKAFNVSDDASKETGLSIPALKYAITAGRNKITRQKDKKKSFS